MKMMSLSEEEASSIHFLVLPLRGEGASMPPLRPLAPRPLGGPNIRFFLIILTKLTTNVVFSNNYAK